MWSLYNRILTHINHFDIQDWLLALVVVVGVGFLCLKGLGSNSKL